MQLKKLNSQSLILFLLLQIKPKKEKLQILLPSHFFNCLLSLCYIFSVFSPLFHLSMLLQNSSMCLTFSTLMSRYT